ncbi:MAG: hypothetical protein AB7G93_08475 [Bdellovibrionales bacterium]
MHYKTNRLNHDFQIAYFIAGSCHTPDAAYGILCDLREDRNNALKMFEGAKLREEARRVRARKKLESQDEADRLEARADLADIEAMKESTRMNYEAAVAELAFIEKCMAVIQPHRKFKHLPDPEAHEAAQREEWKYELIHRAENFLLTSGTIPPDHFTTMRQHPDFQSEIWPAIQEIRELVTRPGGQETLMKRLGSRAFDLPKLLTRTRAT